MQRRYVILAMAAILTLGVVTPVFSSSPATDLALERAKKAKRIAKNARDAANQALTNAQQARILAEQADQGAQRANTRLDEQQIVSARADGS